MTDHTTHQQASAVVISATWDQAADGSYTATVRVSGLASEEQAKGDVRRMREALSAPSCLSANPNAQPPHRPDDSCPDKACKMMGACMRASQGNYPAAPDGWRPIETAPKNGKDLLIFTTDRLVRLAFFDRAREGVWSCWPGRARIYPTHWLPLPAAPSPGAEGTIKQDLSVGGGAA